MSRPALGDATGASDARAKVDTAEISTNAEGGGVATRQRAAGRGGGQ